MDIRDHYITSFFFHIIALLLAAALSRTHSMPTDAFAVSLSADTFGKSSVPAQEKMKGPEVAKPVEPVPSKDISPAEAENSVKEETPAEEKSESTSPTGKISEVSPPATTGIPGAAQDATWLAQIHHTYYSQAGAFMANLSQTIEKDLRREIEISSKGTLLEGTAAVTFYFNNEGGLGEIWGATNSAELKSALNHLDWLAVPLPGSYSLRIKRLLVKIKIANGEPTLTVNIL